MKFSTDTFKGMAPKYAAKLLPENGAASAMNCALNSGKIVPHKEAAAIQSAAGDTRTIYLWKHTGQPFEPAVVPDISPDSPDIVSPSGSGSGSDPVYPAAAEWLEFDYVADIVRGPIADDQYSRIYWTGHPDGKMRMRGTFGDRLAELPQPAAPSDFELISTLDDLFDGMELWLHIGPDATGAWKPHKLVPLEEIKRTDNKWTIKVHFPGASSKTSYAPGWLQLTPQLVFADGSTLPQSYGPSTVIEKNHIKPVKNWHGKEIGYIWVYSHTESVSAADLAHVWPTGTISYITPRTIELTIELIYNTKSKRDCYYLQRYTADTGAEGPPGDLSAMVSVRPDEKVKIKSLGNDADAPAHVVKKRLYRSAGTGDNAGYYYLAEVNKGVTEYEDDKGDEDLGEEIPDIADPPMNPPDGLSGLVVLPGGFLAGFKGRDVYFSEQWLPYSWRYGYALTVDYDIVGLGVRLNSLIVMTTGTLYRMIGDSPAEMTQDNTGFNQACISKRGITNINGAVAYPAADGLVLVGPGGPQVITSGMYRKEDWARISPSTLTASEYRGAYWGFAGGRTIIIDLKENLLTESDETAAALHYDLESGKLYLLRGGSIYELEGGTENKQAVWHSRTFREERPASWNTARIIAENYPELSEGSPSGSVSPEPDRRLQLIIHACGREQDTIYLKNGEARRLPPYRKENEWSFEIRSYERVDRIALGASIAEV